MCGISLPLEVAMTVDTILNTILFIIAGFCFGIFASRYSVIATAKILTAKKVFGVGLRLFFGCLASVLFLFIAFFFFPLWLSTHTVVGAFVYYAVLIFYYSMGWRKLHRK
jgi:uncharacterized membrane protein YGL010W